MLGPGGSQLSASRARRDAATTISFGGGTLTRDTRFAAPIGRRPPSLSCTNADRSSLFRTARIFARKKKLRWW